MTQSAHSTIWSPEDLDRWFTPERCEILDRTLGPGLDALASYSRAVKQAEHDRRPRKPRLKTILTKAKKAGASSVTTPEGFIYTLATTPEPQDPIDRELAEFARRHGKA